MQMNSPGTTSPDKLMAMAFLSISTFSSRSLPSSAALMSFALAGLSKLTIIEHDRSTASAMLARYDRWARTGVGRGSRGREPASFVHRGALTARLMSTSTLSHVFRCVERSMRCARARQRGEAASDMHIAWPLQRASMPVDLLELARRARGALTQVEIRLNCTHPCRFNGTPELINTNNRASKVTGGGTLFVV